MAFVWRSHGAPRTYICQEYHRQVEFPFLRILETAGLVERTVDINV